ncbi:MAG: DUF2520 domain-containing protein [Bacteroidales bacterium]|nr:DUF2520 domain-containing protein [Bacteroidales bacterium]
MPGEKNHEIVILGAGRLATHLGTALCKNGLKILQVYNRTAEKGEKLANRTGASFTNDILGITVNADYYIMAVADSVIREMSAELRLKDKLVVHTSGTMEMDVLGPISSQTGVFYPVQTFSQNRRVDFRKIPVCIEGNSKVAEEQLILLAKKLTPHVYCLDGEKRRLLHLGAVFTSNFANHLFAVTEELLRSHDIPFLLLEPLIMQTARNVRYEHLDRFQTGPAARGDREVIEEHRKLLADHPDYLAIYNLITENIIRQKSNYGKL